MFEQDPNFVVTNRAKVLMLSWHSLASSILVASGVVIAGAKLTLLLLQLLLEMSEKMYFKIAIGIDNESTFKWREGHLYFLHGNGNEILPYGVESGKSDFCNCRGALI